jgi:hypothetical protein
MNAHKSALRNPQNTDRIQIQKRSSVEKLESQGIQPKEDPVAREQESSQAIESIDELCLLIRKSLEEEKSVKRAALCLLKEK